MLDVTAPALAYDGVLHLQQRDVLTTLDHAGEQLCRVTLASGACWQEVGEPAAEGRSIVNVRLKMKPRDGIAPSPEFLRSLVINAGPARGAVYRAIYRAVRRVVHREQQSPVVGN